MEQILNTVNDIIWGPPLLTLLLFVGIYLTLRLRFIQVRHFVRAHKCIFQKNIDSSHKGAISNMQALMTALAATIGIGSITGVATAVAIGGLGAIFWMWVAAFFGMATKYAEGILAVKFRESDGKNHFSGGPMYFLKNGLGFKSLGVLFAVFTAIAAFGTGNMVQANSIAEAVYEIAPVISPFWVSVFLVLFIGLPLLGGIERIGRVVTVLVPSMAIFYLIVCSLVLCMRLDAIVPTLALICKLAFTGQAAQGGFIGSTVMIAIQMGVSRGIFSSEAGLGTSSIASAAARTDFSARQALVLMSSVFITTGIVCTLTGLVIGTTNVLGQMHPDGSLLNGSSLVLRAFEAVIPGGGFMVMLAMIPFAYSTILGWAYYGEKATEYLWGKKSILWYRIFYILFLIPGAFLKLEVVWGFANAMNGLMVIPNLIGVFLLTPIVVTETKLFEKSLEKVKSFIPG